MIEDPCATIPTLPGKPINCPPIRTTTTTTVLNVNVVNGYSGQAQTLQVDTGQGVEHELHAISSSLNMLVISFVVFMLGVVILLGVIADRIRNGTPTPPA